MVGGTNSIVTNSADSYVSGYLSSTVHTPVKRYVPSTNTIATDIYSDSTNMPQLTTMQQQQQQQQICKRPAQFSQLIEKQFSLPAREMILICLLFYSKTN